MRWPGRDKDPAEPQPTIDWIHPKRARSQKGASPGAVVAKIAGRAPDAPVAARRISFERPGRRPASTAVEPRWVPLSSRTVVADLSIGGGLYVGRGLADLRGEGPEPALIDPTLAADVLRPDSEGHDMGYWPTYSGLTPASRAAYLQWLAAGRLAGAYVGFAFLYFYGLERRVLLDATRSGDARAEVPDLLAEVRRLRDAFGDSGSFYGYATNFLETADVLFGLSEHEPISPDRLGRHWEVPLSVQLAIGRFAAAGEPVPAEWALSWALAHPGIRLRTPAVRCPDEFSALFRDRYRERFGTGMTLDASGAALEPTYRAASPSFGGKPVALSGVDIPDVTLAPGPTADLDSLVQGALTDLEPFSRMLGRTGDAASPSAIALLPPALVRLDPPTGLVPLADSVPCDGTEYALVRLADLRAIAGVDDDARLSKAEAQTVSTLLAAYGIALEPDITRGTWNVGSASHAVLWRDPEPTATPGTGFIGATVLLHLGMMVSASDGHVSGDEIRALERRLETVVALTDAGNRRLRAHLSWLLSVRPGAAGVKAKLKTVDLAGRRSIAQFLLTVAAADGYVSPEEVDVLQDLYRLLGLDPANVHRDVHGMTVSSPVTVAEAEVASGDRTIPGHPDVGAAQPPSDDVGGMRVALDLDRIAEVVASTARVSELLDSVFTESDEPAPWQDEPDTVDEASRSLTIGSLDATHSTLVQQLSAKGEWTRAEFDALTARLQLMPGGAIEVVNTEAFDVSGGPLLEGDDPLEVDGQTLKEMMDA